MNEFVTLRKGLVQVNRNGEVKRLGRKGWVVASPVYTSVGNIDKRYRVDVALITYMDGDKQKQSTIKKLVAEAFMDDYEDGDNIVHVDGDFKNCSFDNLKIINEHERATRSHKTRLENKELCPMCNEMKVVYKGLCKSCRKERERMKRVYLSDYNLAKKANNNREYYKNVELDKLDNRTRDYFEMLFTGYNMREIGDKHGVSREAVRQRILKEYEKTKGRYIYEK